MRQIDVVRDLADRATDASVVPNDVRIRCYRIVIRVLMVLMCVCTGVSSLWSHSDGVLWIA